MFWINASCNSRGWAAITIIRPGYGHSDGRFVEDIGYCADRDFAAAGARMAGEVTAILDAVRDLPWLDSSRVLLVGHSGGGFASLAAAASTGKSKSVSSSASIVGVISFAGGLGAPEVGTHFCQPERLVEVMRRLGATTHVPSLWIYTQNDILFPPQLARAMFDAYRSGGAPARLVADPDYRDDGHDYVDAPTLWHNAVEYFLAGLHLPATEIIAEPPDVTAPSTMTGNDSATFFRDYLNQPYEKAIAIGTHGGGGYAAGYPTVAAAKAVAMRNCRQKDSGCHIYAVGDQPVL